MEKKANKCKKRKVDVLSDELEKKARTNRREVQLGAVPHFTANDDLIHDNLLPVEASVSPDTIKRRAEKAAVENDPNWLYLRSLLPEMKKADMLTK